MIRSLLISFLVGCTINPIVAQQPADCGSCACSPNGSWLGTNLTTAVTAQCDTTLDLTLQSDRFGRFFATAGDRYTISTCDLPLDTWLMVTTNTTIPGVIDCNDDGCGIEDGPASVSFVAATDGLFRVYVFLDSCNGSFAPVTDIPISISCFTGAPPVNDLPCGAIPLPEDGSPVPGDNEFATNSQSQVPGVGAPPSCMGALYQGADLWYTAVVPPSGIVSVCTEELTLCAGALQFYTATNCSGTFSQLPFACSVSGSPDADADPALSIDAFSMGLAVGQMIYIRHWERNGNENGTFQIQQCDLPTGVISHSTTVPFIRTDMDNQLILINGSSSSIISIYDLNGRIVDMIRSTSEGMLSIQIHDLPTGIYVLEMRDLTGSQVERFVKF